MTTASWRGLLALQAQIEEEKSSLEASRAELESAKKEQEAAGRS